MTIIRTNNIEKNFLVGLNIEQIEERERSM